MSSRVLPFLALSSLFCGLASQSNAAVVSFALNYTSPVSANTITMDNAAEAFAYQVFEIDPFVDGASSIAFTDQGPTSYFGMFGWPNMSLGVGSADISQIGGLADGRGVNFAAGGNMNVYYRDEARGPFQVGDVFNYEAAIQQSPSGIYVVEGGAAVDGFTANAVQYCAVSIYIDDESPNGAFYYGYFTYTFTVGPDATATLYTVFLETDINQGITIQAFTVPEPSTTGLAAAGAAGLLVVTLRRRRARA